MFQEYAARVERYDLHGLDYPLVIKPLETGIDPFRWAEDHKAMVQKDLHRFGAILFRDFPLHQVQDFNKFVAAFGGEMIDYKERSSPRHEVEKKIYTSTDHPADQVINMHNENSYSRSWPLKLYFYCDIPSARGGETPIADSRRMLAMLSKSTKKKFREKGVLYVRNLGGMMGLNWDVVFQTTDRSVVEAYCKQKDIVFNWKDDNRLQLKYYAPAIRIHPQTGDESWFNHAFFYNILSLDPQFVEEILTVMDKEDFSFLSYYGDGEEIEEAVIDEIRSCFEQLKVSFLWQKGDVLLVDNMLMAHGRAAYEGERRILVAMTDPQYHHMYL
ncbi:TauD/TfdA family dioxygenase [Chitinophaga qingshengii]|uniref:TauD/TfdA family dioxygenase n=1 Tax=Chitinophaga qingshengii TaxID=1569794 RepID=A0ABR7TIQ0_9BACT|nr:TauD/TfdA family dioxygenase [Chitinophaga qingshengii]MBC9929279.1 TauD/TfdA family dioxygenase [Chitinophaga qingshengii]